MLETESFCLPYILQLSEIQGRRIFFGDSWENKCETNLIQSFSLHTTEAWVPKNNFFFLDFLSFSSPSVFHINNESASCLLRFPGEISILFTRKKWKENLLPWHKVLFLLMLVNVPLASAAFLLQIPTKNFSISTEVVVSHGCLTSLDAIRLTRIILCYSVLSLSNTFKYKSSPSLASRWEG